MKNAEKASKQSAADPSEGHFWSTIWEFIGPQRTKIIGSSICAAVVGVAVALQPIMIKWIIDNGVLGKGADGTLLPLDQRLRQTLFYVGLYIALSAVRMTVGVSGVYLMIDGIEQFLADVRSRFFRHVQQLCFRFHDRVSSGELFNYIMGSPLQSLKMFLHQGAVNIPIQVVSWVVVVATLSTFNWEMSLITLAVITVIVMVNRRSELAMKKLSGEFLKTESNASKYVADMLRGSRAVKIYAIEDQVAGRFDYQVHQMRNEGARLARLRTNESAKAEALQYLGMAIIFAIGSWFCLYREMEVGTLFAFVASISVLMRSMMVLVELNLVKANAEAGLNRIMAILHEQKSTPEPSFKRQTPLGGFGQTAHTASSYCVTFDKVSFSYSERPVINEMSVEIPDGQSVALVGPSGSGKSTFISLLLRLYDVQGGKILLNGEDLRAYSLKSLRASFSVVPQDPFIFQGSVLDNIRVTRPDAPMGEIEKAMEIAYVTEFIDTLPHGLATEVGEGGSSLSGGQRQRIAIARAVLAQPRYFIFDEATSALDNESERKIQSAMEHLMANRTSFVIAHRLSTVRNLNRILVFRSGTIVQDGSYADLAAQPGQFRDLLKSSGEAVPEGLSDRL